MRVRDLIVKVGIALIVILTRRLFPVHCAAPNHLEAPHAVAMTGVTNASAAALLPVKTPRRCVHYLPRTVMRVRCGIQSHIDASLLLPIAPLDRGKMRPFQYASHVSVVNLARRVGILQNQMPVQSVPLENMHRIQDKLLHALIAHHGVLRHQKALQVAWEHYLDG